MVLVACAADPVAAEYKAARKALRVSTEEVSGSWEPDVRLWLSPRTLRDAVAMGLDKTGTLTTSLRLGPLTVQPTMTVRELGVSSAEAACDTCVRVDAILDGEVITKGLPGSPRGEVSVSAGLDVRLELVRDRGDLVVRALPVGVNDVAVTLPGAAWRLAPGVQDVLATFVRASLLDKVPSVDVERIPAADLPVLAARVEGADKGLQVALRTASPTFAPLSGQTQGGGGFALRMSSGSLVGLLGQAAMAQGPVARGVVPVVSSLSFDDGTFHAGARLWHPAGGGCAQGGWWHDLEARGTVRLRDDQILLAITDVEPGEASAGALLGDPAVALGVTVLPYLTNLLTTALPAVHGGVLDGRGVDVTLTDLVGDRGDVVVRGKIRVEEGP